MITVFDKFKYRLKQIIIFVDSLWVIENCEGKVIYHNATTKTEISKKFSIKKQIPLHLFDIKKYTKTKFLYVLLILFFGIKLFKFIYRINTKLDILVLFYDGNLSGYYIVTLLEDRVDIHTLQHGIYDLRNGDTRLAIENFISKVIYVWDAHTLNALLEYGINCNRILKSENYLPQALYLGDDTNETLIAPDYDQSKSLENIHRIYSDWLSSENEIVFSFHPNVPAKISQNFKIWDRKTRPRRAICGFTTLAVELVRNDVPVFFTMETTLGTAVSTQYTEKEIVDKLKYDLGIANES